MAASAGAQDQQRYEHQLKSKIKSLSSWGAGGRESHDFPLFHKRSKTSYFVTYRYSPNISHLRLSVLADFSLNRAEM